MGFYLIKRLLLMIPLFIGITIISFGVIHLAPGSPIDMATDLNPKATAEVKERMRAFYGLDKPLHVQYWNWMSRLVTLDFGNSFSQDGRKVADKILERLPITIFINVASLADHHSGGHPSRRSLGHLSAFPFRQGDDGPGLHRALPFPISGWPFY